VRRDRARELFARGAALAAEERYRDALAAFVQSARLYPHASTTYNIGFCERALGRVTRTRKYLLEALALDTSRAGGELTSAQRATAEQLLAEVGQKIARVRVSVEPETLQLAVDGRPLETSEGGVILAGTLEPDEPQAAPARHFELLLDPGAHVFLIADGRGRRQFLDHRFSSGQNQPILLAIQRDRALIDRAELPAPYWNGRRVGAVALGCAGAVGLAFGSGFAANAGSLWSDATDACPAETRCPDDRGRELSSEARLHGSLATTSFAIAAAAFAGGALLWFTAGPTAPEPITLGIHPGGLELSGSF
jgi:hypothetical protein